MMLYQDTRHEASNASDNDLIFSCMDAKSPIVNELARRYSFVLAKLAVLNATMDTLDQIMKFDTESVE